MKALAAAVLIWGLTASAGAADPPAPQVPFAVGSMASVLQVRDAATACGVGKMRIETGNGWPDPSVARLYYDEAVTPSVDHCVMRWETVHGKALGLRPRWQGDTFKQDAPPGAKWW
jgi:hypothetical protein